MWNTFPHSHQIWGTVLVQRGLINILKQMSTHHTWWANITGVLCVHLDNNLQFWLLAENFCHELRIVEKVTFAFLYLLWIKRLKWRSTESDFHSENTDTDFKEWNLTKSSFETLTLEQNNWQWNVYASL